VKVREVGVRVEKIKSKGGWKKIEKVKGREKKRERKKKERREKRERRREVRESKVK
jgi:hypothetical protein